MSDLESTPIVDNVEALRQSAADAVNKANINLHIVSPAQHEQITNLQRAAARAAIDANLHTPSLQPIVDL